MIRKYLASKASIAILVTLILTSVVGVTYAIGVDGPKVKDLSLQEAVELALKNNPEMEVAKLKVTKAEISVDGAKRAAKDARATEEKNGTSYQNSLVKDYNPTAAEVSLEIEKRKYELSQHTLESNVEKAYYNALKAKKDLTIKRETLNNAQEQLKIAQSAFKIGTMAKVDVVTIEAAVAGAQASVVSAENTYKKMEMELNRITGLDLDSPLALTSNFELQKIDSSIDLQKTISEALADNVEVFTVKKNLELMKLQLDVAKGNYGAGATKYNVDSYNVDTKIAEANIRSQELKTTSNIKQSYLTLFTLEKMIDWQTKEVEKNEENCRVLMVKYKAGLATSLDVKNANVNLDTAKESLAGTIYDYNLLKSQFKYKLFY